MSVAVTCVDDPPLAVDDSATVAEDSGASAIAVLANDADVDGVQQGGGEVLAGLQLGEGELAQLALLLDLGDELRLAAGLAAAWAAREHGGEVRAVDVDALRAELRRRGGNV